MYSFIQPNIINIMGLTLVGNNFVGDVLTGVASLVTLGAMDASLFDIKPTTKQKIRFAFTSVVTGVKAFDSLCDLTDTSDRQRQLVPIELDRFYMQEHACIDEEWGTDYGNAISFPDAMDLDPESVLSWVEEHASNFSEALELARWSGDKNFTTLDADDPLRRIDGVMTQIKALGAHNATTNPTGYQQIAATAVTQANVLEEIDKVYSALPLKVRKHKMFKIIISPQVADALESRIRSNNNSTGRTKLPAFEWDMETGQVIKTSELGAPVYVCNGLDYNGNRNTILAGIFGQGKKGVAKYACLTPKMEGTMKVTYFEKEFKIRFLMLSAQNVGILPDVRQIALNA